ncbi:MAG: polysaccharide biosynthesis/export family protein [Planctomycetes bacterium]|nr:polysaccharide biosynthesis/export family protein [Planctomycetota bacterium]
MMLLLTMLSSCATPAYPIREGYQFEFAASPARSALPLLGPGATVVIKFRRTPELDETQLVRPDGMISMPMIGEVDVNEKTPDEVADALLRAYEGKLIDPEIRVLIQKPANRRVFVGGQVLRGGAVEMPGRMTALEAVMQAGGPDLREACLESVIVVRHEGDKRIGYLVDLDKSLRGEVATPFHLRNNDIVYVPQTTIAKIDQWIDQHINKLFPQFGLFYRTPVGSAEVGFQTTR